MYGEFGLNSRGTSYTEVSFELAGSTHRKCVFAHIDSPGSLTDLKTY